VNEPAKKFGRIDVHSHLLPGVDDGCASLAESIQCARELVRNGYTHSFCTPHIWPNLMSSKDSVWRNVAELQKEFDRAMVPLELIPGGELTFRPGMTEGSFDELPTYGMKGKVVLIDIWVDKLPGYFEPTVRWMQGHGATVVLAHPERLRAVQMEPELADYFAEIGLLLQGNLQCIADPPHALTRQTADRFLKEDRYWMLGSDLHKFDTLPIRMAGLKRAIEILGGAKVDELTIDHPHRLIVNIEMGGGR
jgi:protein-tyrosine phosphatase